ncbi:hypothetical protein CRM22_002080 [Opisthorchis felineus]|uniref:Uncharacterized protein n=1 Tax=Opisthorchis felineus TaxID=147828 RepID=A0A4S2MDL8_OPIFE|nr:hypothetical protein CRM22_002080 [Opisthorchis felineus]
MLTDVRIVHSGAHLTCPTLSNLQSINSCTLIGILVLARLSWCVFKPVCSQHVSGMPKYCVEFIADVSTISSRDVSECSDNNDRYPRRIDSAARKLCTSPLLITNDSHIESPGIEPANIQGQSSNSAVIDTEGNSEQSDAENPPSSTPESDALSMGNAPCCMSDRPAPSWNHTTIRPKSAQYFTPKDIPVYRTFVISRAVQCVDRPVLENAVMSNNHSYHELPISGSIPNSVVNDSYTKHLNRQKTPVFSTVPRENLESTNLLKSTSELSMDISSVSIQRQPDTTNSRKPPIHGTNKTADPGKTVRLSSDATPKTDEDGTSLSEVVSAASSSINFRDSLRKHQQTHAFYVKSTKTRREELPTKRFPDTAWSTHKNCLDGNSPLLFDSVTFGENLFSSESHQKHLKREPNMSRNSHHLQMEGKQEDAYDTPPRTEKRNRKDIHARAKGDFSLLSDMTFEDTSSVSSLEQPQLLSYFDCSEQEEKILKGLETLPEMSTTQLSTTVKQMNGGGDNDEPETILGTSLAEHQQPKEKSAVITGLQFSKDQLWRVSQSESKVQKLNSLCLEGTFREDKQSCSDLCAEEQPVKNGARLSSIYDSGKEDSSPVSIRNSPKPRCASESRLPTPKFPPPSSAYRPVTVKVTGGKPADSNNAPKVEYTANSLTNQCNEETRSDSESPEPVTPTSTNMTRAKSNAEPQKCTTPVSHSPPQTGPMPSSVRHSRRPSTPSMSVASDPPVKDGKEPVVRKRDSHSVQSRPMQLERPPSTLPLPPYSRVSPVTNLKQSTTIGGEEQQAHSSKSSSVTTSSCLNLTLKPEPQKQLEIPRNETNTSRMDTNANRSTSTTGKLKKSFFANPPVQIPVGGRRQSDESIVSVPLHTFIPSPNLNQKKPVRRKFYIPESANIETILADPDDRRIKAICERYKCDVEIYSKLPWCGFLQYIVVLSARDSTTLRRCARTLDCRLNWCLNAQLR